MPRWDQEGGRKVTTLFEAAAFQRTIEVKCRCGHSAILNAHALWWHFHRLSLDGRIERVSAHLRCSECPRRGWVTIKLSDQPATDTRLPLPPAQEWKRAVNRFRN